MDDLDWFHGTECFLCCQCHSLLQGFGSPDWCFDQRSPDVAPARPLSPKSFGCTDMVSYKGKFGVLCVGTILTFIHYRSFDWIGEFNRLRLGKSSRRFLCLQLNKPSDKKCFAAFCIRLIRNHQRYYIHYHLWLSIFSSPYKSNQPREAQDFGHGSKYLIFLGILCILPT